MRRRRAHRVDVGDLAFRLTADAWAPDRTLPTVVLVHGIGVSRRYFARLHGVLAARARVVSVDLPGFGGMPKPDRDVDVPTMARALGEALDSLGTGPIVLVGHSMGAQWVVELALQRPELVSLVVAIGPVADHRHRTPTAQARALLVDGLREPPSGNAVILSDYVRAGPAWYLVQLRHMIGYPLERAVERLEVPLLVVRGERDPIAGLRWSRELRDRAPRARLVHVPGHPHAVQHTAPRAVASAILAHTA
ncbi:alpha/beta fold hydrolase [Agrococcus sp. TF02-05]|uniref:alpha/beta fold hydrolase n=1 Tax=Agrococcus sp. TF02-05 TaxID=2815211 RepID=UPI001AA1BF9A|nr:alpha/beta hydrolase [Agrococcus sp. TF02-05]MBO1768668.1 alpha/beta hydrolase [Agrococcus sp. TF02-05]